MLLKGLIVVFPIAFCWMLITYKWRKQKIEKEPRKVLVTGAAGMLAHLWILVFFFPSFGIFSSYIHISFISFVRIMVK